MVHSFYSSAQPSGENTVVLNEVDALRRAGHDVALFAAHTDELEGEVLYKLRAGLRVATGYGRNPLKAINDFSPDVVHIHNLFPNYGHRWLEHLREPLAATLHNYRLLCAAATLYRDGQICTLCPDGALWSSTRFGCYRNSRLSTFPLTWAQMRDKRDSSAGNGPTLLQMAARVIVLTPLMRNVYTAVGVRSEKIVVLSNFLSVAEDAGRPPITSRTGWLFVGRLSEEKGLAELLAQWHPDAPLTVVGSGPQEALLKRKAKGRAVTFAGTEKRDVVRRRMQEARALVFPSRWYEGFPLVYIEALANGLPVLAIEPNAVSTLVNNDGTGMSFPDAGLLARFVHDEHVASLPSSSSCRQVFEQKYTEAAHLAGLEQIFNRIV